ncbi:MAG TPA: DNA polymerase III subunit delta', partial [Beutenbergiaceae bacterium]|nr:DNA polymerase III subunit delta' [Beutenbergiaceae bacterium]
MSVWDALVGQEHAVQVLRHAATTPEAMTHAWLITGPPGSGRSVAARAFAAALQAPEDEHGESLAATTAYAGTHADVRIHTTEKLLITLEEAKELIDDAHRAPAVGPWRIIIVEDADRIAERTSNVLLKSIEEPPPRTVWILCAPSAHDMLPTIRSRCRHISLRIPPAQAVADLLTRDGVDPQLALQAAHASQSHIGVARHLATDSQARQYREMVLSIPGRLTSVGQAVVAAGEVEDHAKKRAKDLSEERDAKERTQLLQDIGVEPGKRPPPALRAQIRALE